MTSTALPISFEFFPPNTPVGDEKLVDVVRQLGALGPEFFSASRMRMSRGTGWSRISRWNRSVRTITLSLSESCCGSSRSHQKQ